MTKSDVIRNGVALITGAGSGLGRALAVELAAQGMRVAGFGRRDHALQETAGLIGDNFLPVALDVADFDAVRGGVAQIGDHWGPVTLLINNAAVYPHRDFMDESPESFMQVMNVNLGGIVACTRAVLDGMCATGVGRIMNVSSFADIAPLPASGAYSVSKGAGRVFTRALVADLGDRFPDVVINTWMPGMLATDMGVAHGLAPEKAAKWGGELALWHDRGLSGTTFEMDREILEGSGLKRRIKALIRLRKPRPPRMLGQR